MYLHRNGPHRQLRLCCLIGQEDIVLDYDSFTDGYTDFQKENCILRRNGVTPYGMYVQCLREIDGRRAVKNGELTDSVRRDLEWFEQRAAELQAELGEIDYERREALDAERYVAKASKELLLDLLASGHPARSTLDLVACLPADDSRRLFRLALGIPREQIVGLLENGYHENIALPAVSSGPPGPDETATRSGG
jgi:hypothetical protein